MTEHQSSRTLVKSAPELWAECSDAASLARHLGAFGEIRITKLEPETTVAWEGAAASGTVKLETSGWGTRVTLTVREETAPGEPGPATEPEPVAIEEPGPVAAAEPEPEAIPQPEPVAVPEPEPEPMAEPEPLVEPGPESVVIAPVPRARMFARFRSAFRRKPLPIVEPDAPEPEVPEPDPVAMQPPEPLAVLELELAPDPPLEPAAEPPPAPVMETPPAPEPAKLNGEEALVAALDSLGMAHHRPYSRA